MYMTTIYVRILHSQLQWKSNIAKIHNKYIDIAARSLSLHAVDPFHDAFGSKGEEKPVSVCAHLAKTLVSMRRQRPAWAAETRWTESSFDRRALRHTVRRTGA